MPNLLMMSKLHYMMHNIRGLGNIVYIYIYIFVYDKKNGSTYALRTRSNLYNLYKHKRNVIFVEPS